MKILNLDFEQKQIQNIRNKIKFIKKSDEKYRVSTPFILGGGDHLKISLKKGNDFWYFSDEGSTYMYLTLKINEDDLFRGNGLKNIQSTLKFWLNRCFGEVKTEVKDW